MAPRCPRTGVQSDIDVPEMFAGEQGRYIDAPGLPEREQRWHVDVAEVDGRTGAA